MIPSISESEHKHPDAYRPYGLPMQLSDAKAVVAAAEAKAGADTLAFARDM
jgi:hypothetical protein